MEILGRFTVKKNILLALLVFMSFVFICISGCSDSDNNDYYGPGPNPHPIGAASYIAVADEANNRIILIDRTTERISTVVTSKTTTAEPLYLTFSEFTQGFYISNPNILSITALSVSSSSWKSGEFAWSLSGCNVPLSLAATPEGKLFAVLTNSDDSKFILVNSQLNASSGASASIPSELPVGGEPNDVIMGRTNIYVSGCGSDANSVAIINPISGAIYHTIPNVGDYGLGLDIAIGNVFVVDSKNKNLNKISLEGTVTATAPLLTMVDPLKPAVMGSRVYVTDAAAAKIHVFDAQSLAPVTVIDNVSPSLDIKVTPENDALYISNTNGTLSTISILQSEVIHNITLPSGSEPNGIAIMARK